MPTADTEIRLVELADADVVAVHQARDREASARWESARPDAFFTPEGQRARVQELLADHRRGSRLPGGVLADGEVIGQAEALHPVNLRPHGVLRNNGFTSYGIAHEHILLQGEWHDEIFWERGLQP